MGILDSENNRRKLHGIGDAAPIAVHLPFHKPDDFLGEFQTAAGEIIPHPEANAAPSDTNYLDSVIEEERNSGRKLLAGITQLSITPFADLVRRRSRTVCQQEFVLEPTLLISLLRQRATVSCWVLEMRPLLLFTFRSTSLIIFWEIS